MVTIFILLGLGFLCGGIAAIVDGLPYMVLERGFTQVIIGTVVAVTGVVMLALSWMLIELRRLRKTLSNAATAISVASMVGGPAPGAAAPSPEAGNAAGAMLPGLLGVGALAGATLAATRASATETTEEPRPDPAEPDLFDPRPADAAVLSPGSSEDSAAETGPVDPDLLHAFDPLRPVDPLGEAQAEPAPEPEFASLLREHPEPDVAEASEPAHPAERPAEPEDEPAPPAAGDADDALMTEPAAPPSPEPADDAFGALRDSLSGLSLPPEPAGGRIEPSFGDLYRPAEPAVAREADRGDELAAAESWMEPALTRRAPWFGNEPEIRGPDPVPSPAEVEQDVAPEVSWPEPETAERGAPETASPDRDLPQWPPQTRQAAPFEQSETVDERATRPGAPAEGAAEDTVAVPETGQPAEEASAGPQGGEAEAAPAASEEGIVGAYQVGEAHFTIYADGSIQARTPDGDYSFASMDELKVYLASEKSRLGV